MGQLPGMPKYGSFYADDKFATETCKRLREFRESTNFTASDVAEHLNMPTALYVLYEEIELVPHRLIPPLCEFLNFSPWFYLTGKPDAESPPFRSES